MSTEEINDNMHKLIIDRLKERQRKMRIIKSYERPGNIVRVVSVVSLLAAACIAGVIFMLPVNQTVDTVDEPIRSSMDNIRELVVDGKYNEALSVIEEELHISDSILKELSKDDNIYDEETRYEVEAQKLRIKELAKEKDAIKKKMK